VVTVTVQALFGVFPAILIGVIFGGTFRTSFVSVRLLAIFDEVIVFVTSVARNKVDKYVPFYESRRHRLE